MDWKLELLPIPVSDVDVAKDFYENKLGFHVDHDTSSGDTMRAVQLTPPGSGCSIAIGVGILDTAPGSVRGVQLVVADIAAARAQLLERGVQVSPVRHFDGKGYSDGPGGVWNSFVFFDDPDGNGWVLQESPAKD